MTKGKTALSVVKRVASAWEAILMQGLGIFLAIFFGLCIIFLALAMAVVPLIVCHYSYWGLLLYAVTIPMGKVFIEGGIGIVKDMIKDAAQG